MIFTDASQPTFPDPWDFPTLSDTPVATDARDDAEADRHEAAASASAEQTTPHFNWREMLADIQHGLQWGLDH